MAERDIVETKGRRARDRSAVLLLVGLLFLLPPFADIGLIDGFVFGIPIPLLYVFLVWAVLIIGGAVLSRPLRAFDHPGDDARQNGNPDTGKADN